MSRDLKEIFDLDHLKRLWGDDGKRPTPPSIGADKLAPPPLETAPLVILDKLEEAISEEFSSAKRPLFPPTLEAIRALVGLGHTGGLDPVRGDDLVRHLDELEDLLDSLALPDGAAPSS